ncbi:MAG: Pyrimidine-nucleoside phosphorylase [Ktedonobacterales bacterium]|jgi:pyrimidine-nucleoside phosphorylase|nr:MAG: Pyrimidine-nucleoside phosphorylase [Ktedonobacterales bacterium]
MNAVEVIRHKRDGKALSAEEIAWFVTAYTHGDVTDYQMAAFCMAVVWRGMTREETVALTLAMLHSGEELHARDVLTPVADKHSTGGVGDKVTLAVAPLVAACGLPIAKMSGRGLGHTGGTVDKLESISGLRTELGRDEFLALVKRHGLALSAQSSELAPADGMMYALRDVTATVDSIPLIAASIMSKKLAVGPSHLLLDVKVGSGAFMKTETAARRLARAMVQIGEDAGVRTVAALSSMEQPLGRAVGNALEVAEAVDILRGTGPADVTELCLHETATLLVMAGIADGEPDGHARAERAVRDGSGLAKLAEVVAAQGGDARQIEDTSLLPKAPVRVEIGAPQSGYITAMDAERIGMASVRLGAGRMHKGDPIDPAVGLVLLAKAGDWLDAGAPLVEVHARSEDDVQAIRDGLLGAYTWGDEAPALTPLLLGSVGRESRRTRKSATRS